MARVLISMPEEFLDRIDQVAEGENRTRSELIREALRSYMYKSRVKANTMAGKNAAILEALLDQHNIQYEKRLKSRQACKFKVIFAILNREAEKGKGFQV